MGVVTWNEAKSLMALLLILYNPHMARCVDIYLQNAIMAGQVMTVSSGGHFVGWAIMREVSINIKQIQCHTE